MLPISSIADLPPALIDDVCYGTSDLPEIFAKYGYSDAVAETFREDPTFQRWVSVRSAELEKEGQTHKIRAGRVADKALMAIAMRLDDPNTPASVLHDYYKTTSQNAGFVPKNVESAQGSGFSITINIPKPGQKNSAKIVNDFADDAIDVTPVTLDISHNPAEFEVL